MLLLNKFNVVPRHCLVVTETVFSWPGLGRLFYDAVFRRDFPLLSGCFIFASGAVILVNLLTDVVCALIDPRISR